MRAFHEKKHDMELSCSLDYQGVVQISMSGNLSSDYEDVFIDWARSVRAAMKEVKSKNPERVLCIIDLTGPIIDTDQKTFKLLIELIRHNKDYVTRTGVYGAAFVTRNLVDIALKATGRKNMKMFVTREEAERWVFTGKK